MELQEKIINALRDSMPLTHVKLWDDDGISGYVVSPQFKGMAPIDRQAKLDAVLRDPGSALTTNEARRVLMIAGLTPREYYSIAAPIRVRRIKQLPEGTVRVFVEGDLSDATYVRRTLARMPGIKTSKPREVSTVIEPVTTFLAKSVDESTLTPADIVQRLSRDPHIQLELNGSI